MRSARRGKSIWGLEKKNSNRVFMKVAQKRVQKYLSRCNSPYFRKHFGMVSNMNQKVQRFMKHCQCVDLNTNPFDGTTGKRQ